jgi:hypothetical protein
MKAYVELVQRKERELGTDVLTHQKVRATFVRGTELTAGAVERSRLCGQSDQDGHGRRVVDGSDGCRCDGDSVCSQDVR